MKNGLIYHFIPCNTEQWLDQSLSSNGIYVQMFCETFLDELLCRFDNNEAEDPNRIYEDDFGENIDQRTGKY